MRRAQPKRDLRDGAAAHLARLLIDPPVYLDTARVFDLLTWLPGVTGPRADATMRAAGVVGALRTLAELTHRQRDALTDLMQQPVPACNTETQASGS